MRTQSVRPVGHADETVVSQTNLKPWIALASLICAGAITTAVLRHCRIIPKSPIGLHIAIATASGLVACGLGYRSWRRQPVAPVDRPAVAAAAVQHVKTDMMSHVQWPAEVTTVEQMRDALETTLLYRWAGYTEPGLQLWRDAWRHLNEQCPYNAREVGRQTAVEAFSLWDITHIKVTQLTEDSVIGQLLVMAVNDSTDQEQGLAARTARKAIRYMVEANPALQPSLNAAQGGEDFMRWRMGLAMFLRMLVSQPEAQ